MYREATNGSPAKRTTQPAGKKVSPLEATLTTRLNHQDRLLLKRVNTEIFGMSRAKMKIDRSRKANNARMLEQMRRTTIFLALGTSLVLAVAEPGWLIATPRPGPVTSHLEA